MTPLVALWLPILLSSVIVFVASYVVHMALPWHRGDYPRLPDEDRVLDALRPVVPPPGDYMLPRPATVAAMRSAEYLEKMKRGPVLLMTVFPNGPPAMGRTLVRWFLYIVVIGVFAGYIAGRALPAGTPYLAVFRFVGTTAFMGYALGLWQMSIWYHRAWSITMRYTVDGLLFALLTAGTFGWLWPR